MLAEPQKVNLIDECNKMQNLSSSQLPDLIKRFELKVNQEKDGSQVKLGRPAAKIKLRDPQEVLEIARLKVLVSEMREKTIKLEAQLEMAAERNRSKEKRNVCDNEDIQEPRSCGNRTLVTKQEAKLEKELQAHIESLQQNVHQMLMEINTRPDLHEELASANGHIKALQEEIKDDASLTKSQLLLLMQQFGKLEEMKNARDRKELEFQRASELTHAFESEKTELKKGIQELLRQKEKLSRKLLSALDTAEKIIPVTKEDLLASEAEVSELRLNNIELQKEIESLQMSRFNEVEELVYLRWVNACLRHELDTYQSSRINSRDDSNQVEYGKDEATSLSDSSRSSTSYNTTIHYVAARHGSERLPQQHEYGIIISPQSGNVNRENSSPASGKGGRRHIKTSPLVIPHSSVGSSHSSPVASPLGDFHGHQSSPLSTPHSISKSIPQSSHDVEKHRSGVLHFSPQKCSISPSRDTYNYLQNKLAAQKDPPTIPELQSMLTFNGHRSGKRLDSSSSMSTYLQNTGSRRTGRSFMRSASSISSSSDATYCTQGIPQKQDTRSYMRSSSNLSTDSGVSFDHQNLRQHSVSPDMSLLHEYLCSTHDTSHHNRPTSRLSAVLPHNRRFSDLENVCLPSMEKVTEPIKGRESTSVKAHSFESQLDASDKLVAAFRKLSISTQAKNIHPSFKDLSRQNSLDSSEAEAHNEHESPKRATQADFICDLAQAIRAAHYNSIEQVAAFVNWFDRQGDVEKQEFFNFPDCPRNKVEAMRRAVYEYEELQTLESDLNSYKGQWKGPADPALEDMKNLLEKVENHINGFKQARDLAMVQFNELHIPTIWMLDSGMIAKVKQAALKLAQRCIETVTDVLEAQASPALMPRDDLLLEAARFILKVHNFSGGFDEKTAKVFKTLQSQACLHDENDDAAC